MRAAAGLSHLGRSVRGGALPVSCDSSGAAVMGVDARAFAYPYRAGPMSLLGKPRLCLGAVRSSWPGPPLAVASQRSKRFSAASWKPRKVRAFQFFLLVHAVATAHLLFIESRGAARACSSSRTVWGYLRTAAFKSRPLSVEPLFHPSRCGCSLDLLAEGCTGSWRR